MSNHLAPDAISIDFSKVDERGYVHIIGRDKDLMISGGYDVYTKEVETEIDQVPGIVETAVLGVPHPYSAKVLQLWS